MNVVIRIKTVSLGLLIMVFTGHCVEPYVPSVIITDHNYLAVDGFLVNNDSTTIRLTRSQSISGSSNFEPESNAIVEIESNEGSRHPLLEERDGVYVTGPLNLDTSFKYRLHIVTKDEHEYFSDFVRIKSTPPLDSVTVFENEATEEMDVKVNTYDPLNTTQYYYWTFDETWEYIAAAVSIYRYENEQMIPRQSASELYRCWKTARSPEFFLHATTNLSEDAVRNFTLFTMPQGSRKLYFAYSVLVKQYALTKEAYDYWTINKRNNETLGGLFDPLPSQERSNIISSSHPGEVVIGHFSACTVQKKRLLVRREQLSGPSQVYEPTGYEDCLSEIVQVIHLSDKSMQNKLVHDALYDMITQKLIGYVVFPAVCLDCRLKGGTNLRPDYWD